jgi:hypothetical protein
MFFDTPKTTLNLLWRFLQQKQRQALPTREETLFLSSQTEGLLRLVYRRTTTLQTRSSPSSSGIKQCFKVKAIP